MWLFQLMYAQYFTDRPRIYHEATKCRISLYACIFIIPFPVLFFFHSFQRSLGEILYSGENLKIIVLPISHSPLPRFCSCFSIGYFKEGQNGSEEENDTARGEAGSCSGKTPLPRSPCRLVLHTSALAFVEVPYPIGYTWSAYNLLVW